MVVRKITTQVSTFELDESQETKILILQNQVLKSVN